MSKVDCKDCHFYHNGRCEELGEYTTPGGCECSWFAPKAIKKTCVAEIAKNAKQTFFDRLTASPEVLAENLVYRYDGNGTWRSFLLYGYEFLTKAEAIAATVAKLKEVAE